MRVCVVILPFCFLLYAVSWLIQVGFPQLSVLSLQAPSFYWTEWLSYVWAPRAEFHTYIQQHERLALINKSHWPWKDMGIRTHQDMPSKNMKLLSIWERCAGLKKKEFLCALTFKEFQIKYQYIQVNHVRTRHFRESFGTKEWLTRDSLFFCHPPLKLLKEIQNLSENAVQTQPTDPYTVLS